VLASLKVSFNMILSARKIVLSVASNELAEDFDQSGGQVASSADVLLTSNVGPTRRMSEREFCDRLTAGGSIGCRSMS
jgi:hypothetical protein